MSSSGLPDSSVLRHVVDVHCHPTDNAPISQEEMDRLDITICAMSSRQSDQHLVRELATANPDKVIPCFGYHPWFSHHISLGRNVSKEDHYRRLFLPNDDRLQSPGTVENGPAPVTDDPLVAFEKLLPSLPDPVPLDEILTELRNNLEAFPNAMLGEVGLDRSFRIPYDYHADPRELTPLTVPFSHQLAVLEAQIGVAIDYRRNISLHSVKAQQATLELFDRMKIKYLGRWSRINIDLHSCGLSVESLKDVQRKHENVYMSISKAINSRSKNLRRLIYYADPKRILVESDYHTLSRCTPETWAIIQTVANAKRWSVESHWDERFLKEEYWGVVRRLEKNWIQFSRGSQTVPYETEYEQ